MGGIIGIGDSSGGSIRSVANSSSNPLGIGGSFIGLGQFNSYPDILVVVFTDQECNLYIELSIDGINWDTSLRYSVDTGLSEIHSLLKGPRFVRIRLENISGVAQTVLRMATMFGQFRQPNVSLNSTIRLDADAIVVRPTNYSADIALGRLQGISSIHKIGWNPDIDSGDGVVTVWPANFGGSASRYTYNSAGTNLFLASSNNSDTSVQVLTEYLDTSGTALEVTQTLNGQTVVNYSLSDFYRLNRSRVVGDVEPLGNIYLANTNSFSAGVPTSAAITRGIIQLSENQTIQTPFTIPASTAGILKGFTVSATTGSTSIRLKVRTPGGVWRTRTAPRTIAAGTTATIRFDDYIYLEPLTDFEFWATGSTNNTSVSLDYDLELVTLI